MKKEQKCTKKLQKIGKSFTIFEKGTLVRETIRMHENLPCTVQNAPTSHKISPFSFFFLSIFSSDCFNFLCLLFVCKTHLTSSKTF